MNDDWIDEIGKKPIHSPFVFSKWGSQRVRRT